MDKYHVKLTFTQPILGTATKDPEVYTTYVQAKQAENATKNGGAELTEAQLAEEVASLPKLAEDKIEEKGWTGFHEQDGQPFLYDYLIKGFFKEACSALRRVKGTRSEKITAYKKIIDGLVFAKPRRIFLVLPESAGLGVLERPLRAQTAQGERVSLARSDMAPVGTMIEFDILVIGEVSEKLLREWLDYGSLKGLGQWRNGGYGSFEYEMEEVI